jgi:hypothetical protein
MKNGPALSVLLAPGGTTMFWVTQAGCDKAIDVKETREIRVPARTDNELVISAPDADESFWLALAQSMTSRLRAVKSRPAALPQWPPCSKRTDTAIPRMPRNFSDMWPLLPHLARRSLPVGRAKAAPDQDDKNNLQEQSARTIPGDKP